MNVGRCFVLALSLAVPTVASAQHGGSMEDQVACTPDVYRLCAAQIPDEDAIVACLKQNYAVLSPACHKVFSSPTPGRNAPAPAQSDD